MLVAPYDVAAAETHAAGPVVVFVGASVPDVLGSEDCAAAAMVAEAEVTADETGIVAFAVGLIDFDLAHSNAVVAEEAEATIAGSAEVGEVVGAAGVVVLEIDLHQAPAVDPC